MRYFEIISEANHQNHKLGDRERLDKVIANYKKVMDRHKELQTYLKSYKNTSPGMRDMLSQALDQINTELDQMRFYFQTYNKFQSTEENNEIDFLFNEGFSLIKGWFEGWYMSANNYKQYGPVLRAFRAVQLICPSKEMTVYRVMTVDDATQAKNLKSIRTGKRSLQSWTTNINAAKRFYQSQYAHGDTMRIDNGKILYKDVTADNDFVIVKARFSTRNVLWTPGTYHQIENYHMHAGDSKLYKGRYINDNVFQVLYEYSNQSEVIVHVPYNVEIPVLSIIPIHVRKNSVNEDLEFEESPLEAPTNKI